LAKQIIQSKLPFKPDSHELSDEQNSFLEKVVAKFPLFSVSGLGKSTLISH